MAGTNTEQLTTLISLVTAVIANQATILEALYDDDISVTEYAHGITGHLYAADLSAAGHLYQIATVLNTCGVDQTNNNELRVKVIP